ncbi:dynein axonemal heavy chain 8-like [Odontesthes bonariensis]|uniref:dynein axonemal heavy chain 8-like n=1 Tax=Odontesthes bonariensis TaxID=219752 RepID=UPI003F583C90
MTLRKMLPTLEVPDIVMMDTPNPKANKCVSQAKHKQAREERKKLLTPAHKYMIDILADRLSLAPTEVEEFVLDSPSLLAFDHFFASGGSKTISFVYQESEVPGIDIQRSNESVVHLKTVTDIDLSKLACLDDMKAAAANFDMVQRLEEILMQWCKQIEQVLMESDLLRKEDDSAGPLSELEHWKRMSLQYNSIIDHIKSPECKAVVMVLHLNHSKIMKVWRDLDTRITYRVNEAKDNFKFLSTLEKVLHPLYNSDPVSMTENVPKVISAIHMIYRVSLYYNTSEKMSALLVKITNQMVTACRSYITDDGSCLIWDQDAEKLIRKMQVCTCLYQEYQTCFQKKKVQVMEETGKTFLEVSEMQIFCKFESFCKQLEKIKKIITVFKTFESLEKSNIEGIEKSARQFHTVSMNLKRKKYDMLSPRTTEFETDFVNFMAQMSHIEVSLQAFMCSYFSNIISSQQALCLLQRFQKLNLPCLATHISNILGVILQHFASEVEFVKKVFDNQKDDIPLSRNMPPVAGRIGWVRHLYKKIEEPILYMKENSDILCSPVGQDVVRMYNGTAAMLVEFELLQHETWMEKVSKLDHVLNITLLVRHPNTGKLVVNFDPKITEVIREAKCLLKMGHKVPTQASLLIKMESKINAHHLRLKVQDICKIQIDDVLKDMSETVLIELPEGRASLLQQLVDHNKA